MPETDTHQTTRARDRDGNVWIPRDAPDGCQCCRRWHSPDAPEYGSLTVQALVDFRGPVTFYREGGAGVPDKPANMTDRLPGLDSVSVSLVCVERDLDLQLPVRANSVRAIYGSRRGQAFEFTLGAEQADKLLRWADGHEPARTVSDATLANVMQAVEQIRDELRAEAARTTIAGDSRGSRDAALRAAGVQRALDVIRQVER